MREALDCFETNGGRDSSGLAWGLEGDLFLYVVGAGVAAILMGMLGFMLLRWSLAANLALTLAPVLVTGVYLKLFRIGKPKSYQYDWLQWKLQGAGVERQRQQPGNPAAWEGK